MQRHKMKHGLTCFGVLPCQHVVGKWRGVCETLQGWVKEAGVPHILQAGTNTMNLGPLEDEPLWREEDLLGQVNPITTAYYWT